MPIITPAYPSMCSTHNVTSSTQAVTTFEFGQAAEIADNILLGKTSWATLFKKHDFFHRYKYYLQVVASTDNPEEHLMWSGLVESRLRQLINKLELVEQIDKAHPFIKGFDRSIVCKTKEAKRGAAHGDLPDDVDENLPAPEAQAKNEVSEGEEPAEDQFVPVTVWTTCFYVGLQVKPKEGSKQLDISWPSTEFMKMVRGWDAYDETKMAISVRCIKKYLSLT